MTESQIQKGIENASRIGSMKGKSASAKIKIDTILEVYGTELPEIVTDMLRKASKNLHDAENI